MSFVKFLKISTYILLLSCCTACYLLTTTSGLGMLVKIAKCFMPGHLSVADIKGSIFSDLQMHHLFYRSNNSVITLKRIHLIWQPKELLSGFLVVEKAHISGIKIKQGTEVASKQPSDATTTNPITSNINWLQRIKLIQVQIDDATFLKSEAKPFEITSLLLTTSSDGDQHISMLSNLGNIHGKVKVNLHQNLIWDTKLIFEHVNGLVFQNNLTSDINFAIESQGNYSAQQKFAQVKLSNFHGKLMNYPIDANAEVTLVNEKIQISSSHLKLADAKLEINGSFGKIWDLAWNIDIPNFQTFSSDWRGNVVTTGVLKGNRQQPWIKAEWLINNLKIYNVGVESATGKIQSEINSRTANLHLAAKKLAIENYQIPESELTSQLRMLDETRIDTVLKLNMGAENYLEGNIVLSNLQNDFWSPQQQITGNIAAHFNDLRKLIVIPYVNNLKGILNGQIKLSGSVTNPYVDVQAKIENGSLTIPKLGTQLDHIQLISNYRSKEALTFSGSLNTGQGKGVLNGTFSPHEPGLPFHLALSGTMLQVMNLPEYKATVSPSLELTAADQQYKLQGTIKVDKARITPKDFSNVQTLPSEVTIIDKSEKASPTTPANFAMKLQVILGDDIKLHYQSLEAGLKGQVFITEKFNSLPVGSGELYTIDGKYKAFGNILDITQGRLIYAGNLLTNPALDIRAQKQFTTVAFAADQTQFNAENALGPVYQGSNQLTVGITVKNTLNSPHLSFFSEPSGLSQTDIMSYLVFGYPRSKIKDMNKLALLNNIASGLNNNTSKVDTVKDKVQKVLGLTDLSFDTVESYDAEQQTTKMNTTINIGKKFGKRFSVHYRIGVFNPVSVLNLKYQINKRFAIQSETSSTDTGADLLFEYEKD